LQIKNLQIKIVEENIEANQKRIDIKRQLSVIEGKLSKNKDQKQVSALKDKLSELNQKCEQIAHS